MNVRLLLTALLTGLVSLAMADATNAPIKIGTKDADHHYDEVMTVTGSVAQVSLRPTIVFINLDQPYPDSPFAAVIHASATNQFGALRALKGRSVELTGKIINYHDRPEMVLEKPTQLYVVGGWSIPTNRPPAIPSVKPAGHAVPTPVPAKGTNDLTTGVM